MDKRAPLNHAFLSVADAAKCCARVAWVRPGGVWLGSAPFSVRPSTKEEEATNAHEGPVHFGRGDDAGGGSRSGEQTVRHAIRWVVRRLVQPDRKSTRLNSSHV